MGSKGGSAPSPAPAGASLVGSVTPWGTSTYNQTGTVRVPDGPDQPMYTNTVTLSPSQQALFGQQQQLNSNLTNLALQQSNQLGPALAEPVSYDSAPPLVGSIGGRGNIQTKLDTSQLQGIPGLGDFGAERDRTEQALYGRQTAMLDPQYAARQAHLDAQLAAQGVPSGTQAYTNANADFARNRDNAYAAARNDAITGAGAEQQRLFGEAMGARQQGFGEQVAQGQFGNAALQQIFNQGQSAAAFQNAARSQSIQEILARRNQPINEISALLGSGGQVQMPQFNSSGQGATTAASQAANAAAMANWQDKQASQQATQSEIMGLIGTAAMGAMVMSDARMKDIIMPAGKLGQFNLYLYRFKGEQRRRLGVIAQEVRKVAPDLVHAREDGMLAVDYGGLFHRAGQS